MTNALKVASWKRTSSVRCDDREINGNIRWFDKPDNFSSMTVAMLQLRIRILPLPDCASNHIRNADCDQHMQATASHESHVSACMRDIMSLRFSTREVVHPPRAL